MVGTSQPGGITTLGWFAKFWFVYGPSSGVDDGIHGTFRLEAVTPAMINNYVKNKVIVAPAKKKYQVMQIADILLLTLLKQSFSIQEIRSGIDRVTASEYPKQAYDRFIDLLNKKISLIGKSRPDRHAENLTDQLLEAASDMVVDQLETNQLVKIVKNSKSHEPTKIK